MNKLISLFKKKIIKKIPLWETNFEKFCENFDENKMSEYVSTISNDNPKEIDYTTKTWGHTFNTEKTIKNIVHYGYGFYSGSQIIGTRKIKEGDFLLLNNESEKVGKYLILKIKYEKNPRDMYWAYIVCIGYK